MLHDPLGPAPVAVAPLPEPPAEPALPPELDSGEEGGPAPQGSGYDAAHQRRASKRLGRRIRGWISWNAVGALARVFPYLYYAYCWLVWRTGRHTDDLKGPIEAALARHGRVVTLMWHEDVFITAFSYGPLRGDALASTSNFGRIITRMLEYCGCNVFRGGSTGSASVRRQRVLPDMIAYMNTARYCLYGLTVDGSRGPVYRMKTGGLVIARACRAPIYLVRTWCGPSLRLPTWDRTALPLPFGRIYRRAVGPYWIAPDADDEELRRAHVHLEAELLELADHSFRHFEGPASGPRARRGFPDGWTPRWAPGQLGLPRVEHDLRPDEPPSWAVRALPA